MERVLICYQREASKKVVSVFVSSLALDYIRNSFTDLKGYLEQFIHEPFKCWFDSIEE